MGCSSKGINGATVWYDTSQTTHERWFDAIGGDVVKFIMNPGTGVPTDDTTGDPTQWTMTVTEAGAGGDTTCVNAVTKGIALLITTDNADYDGINLQVKGEQFEFETAKELYFGCKFAVSEATQSDLLIGLMQTKTDLLKTGTAHGINSDSGVEGAFLFKVDAGTTLQFKTYKDNAEKNTADYGTALDTEAHIFEMYWDGAQLKGYIDGSLVATFTSNLPDEDLTPSINFRTGAAAAETMDVYWMRVIECR